MAVYAVADLAFAYGPAPVLREVSFSVGRGELVCLLGPNGCGKTTLLRLLLGLLPPTAGRIRLAGRDIAGYGRRELARNVAYVPQAHHPAFAYTALDMVLMGRCAHGSMFGRPSARDRDIALAALRRFSIDHLRDTAVTRLSGGQRQLTLLARALAQQSPVLVLDEPTNGLDFGHQAKFLEILRELCAEGLTCVMTTHFPDHALWVSGHAVLLRDGRVVADGAPRDVVASDTLGRLYDVAISVVPLGDAIRVCVPDRLGRPARPRASPGQSRDVPDSRPRAGRA